MQMLSLSFLSPDFLSTCFNLNMLNKGTRNNKCIWGQERDVQNRKQKAATRKINPLAFLDEIAKKLQKVKNALLE